MKKICCIGHITKDRIITPQQTIHMHGGTSYYFSYAMSRIGQMEFYQLVTALSESEMGVVSELRSMGVCVDVIPSKDTVFFENKYAENMNNRTQRVLAKSDSFQWKDVSAIHADIYHLGALLADDFSVNVIRNLSQKGMVSVDAQGFLREVRGEDVHAIDWANKLEVLPYIHILKVNEQEMKALSGISDPIEAAKMFADWGIKEVIITLGDQGSLIYAQGNYYAIPAFAPTAVVDVTGCGDTYMAGYLYQRSKGVSYDEAGRFAAAMCTLKLAHSGPFCHSTEEVENVMQHSLTTLYQGER